MKTDKIVRILLVEDSPDQAGLVCDYLNLKANFQITWVDHIKDIWKNLDEQSFDAVLLDYWLPDGTGLEALGEIRAKGIRIPVVMVTGQGDEKIAATAIQQGASEYLVKTPEYYVSIPVVIERVIREFKLNLSIERAIQRVRYQSIILKNVKDAVIVWDKDGKITFLNPAAEILFGLSEGTCLGGDVETLYFSLFDQKHDFGQLNYSQDLEMERQFLNKKDQSVWISSRITKIEDGEQFLGWMDVCRDINERKRLQKDIQIAQSQLVQNTRMAVIGELASGVAHRIYNPLTAIIANSQVLLKNLDTHDLFEEILKDIEKAGWEAQEIVGYLLDFSQADKESFEHIEINETIGKAIALIGAAIQSEGSDISISLSPENPIIFGNYRQIVDLWVNLLFVSRDGKIEGQTHEIDIRTEILEDFIVIEVLDNGKQISQESLINVFEPDFIGHDIGRGNGMELSICREIVRQHNGQISITSNDKITNIRTVFNNLSEILDQSALN
ncbi:MAG: response regulator [Anaerolineaceae bacterium]|nr:response regulator [Anaerolineaceae bacterium]